MNKGSKFVVTALAGVTLLGGGLMAGASAGYVDWSGTGTISKINDNLSTLGSILETRRDTIAELTEERDLLLDEKAKAEKELDKLEDVTHEDKNFQTDGNHALRIRFAREHYEKKVRELAEVTAALELAEAEIAEHEDLQRRVEDALDKMERKTEGPDTNGNFIARIAGITSRYEDLEDELNELTDTVESALDDMEEATGGPDTNGNFVARIFGVKTRFERLEDKYEQADEDVDNVLIKSELLLNEHDVESESSPE